MKALYQLETWIRSRGLSTFMLRAAGLSVTSVLAQCIALGNLTLVGRFFEVETVGYYYVFSSYAAILSGIVLLGYQVILPHLNQQDFEALIQAQLAIIVIICLGIYAGFSLAGYQSALALAFYSAAMGFMALCQMMNIRSQNFRLMTSISLIAPLLFTLWLLLHMFSRLHYSEVLIIGQTLSLGGMSLIYTILTLNNARFKWTSWHHCLEICLRKYRQPFWTMPATLLNNLTYNLPVILIERFFGPSWAACYGVVLRFCFGPIGILGNSLGSAYHSELARTVRESLPNGIARYEQVRRLLRWGGLGLGLGLLLFFPSFVTLLLGESWRDAGWMGQLLSPLFGCMLALSPLGIAIYIFEKQAFDFVSQVAYILISVLAFGIGIFTQQLWLGILLFSLLSCLRYLITGLYCHRLTINALTQINELSK